MSINRNLNQIKVDEIFEGAIANRLASADIETFADFIGKSLSDLYKIRLLGDTRIMQIQNTCAELGIHVIDDKFVYADDEDIPKYKYYCPRCGYLNRITDDEMGRIEGKMEPMYFVKKEQKHNLYYHYILCKNCKRGHHILRLYIVEE